MKRLRDRTNDHHDNHSTPTLHTKRPHLDDHHTHHTHNQHTQAERQHHNDFHPLRTEYACLLRPGDIDVSMLPADAPHLLHQLGAHVHLHQNGWARAHVPLLGVQRGYHGVIYRHPCLRHASGLVANDDGYILEPLPPLLNFSPPLVLYRTSVTSVHEALM